MVKVLIVCHDRYLSGANRALLDWLADRDQLLIDATVLLPGHNTESEQRFKSLGCNVWSGLYTVPAKQLCQQSLIDRLKGYFKLFWAIFINPILVLFFAKKAKALGIQIVHSNTFATTFGEEIAEKMKVPHIWHIREFCEADHGFTHYWPKRLKKQCNYSNAIFISEAVRNYYKDKYHFKSEIVINDKVSFDSKIKKKRSFMEDGVCNMLIVGTISEGKGQLEAIQAAKRLHKAGKRVRLYICGQGERRYIEREKSGYEECIIDLGYRRDVNQLRSNIDLALVCSRMEAFGRVTVEAQYYYNVVIGSRSGCTPYIINDGVTGFLYTHNDVNDLVKKINYCIQNPNRMKNIMINARIEAISRFSNKISPMIYREYILAIDSKETSCNTDGI